MNYEIRKITDITEVPTGEVISLDNTKHIIEVILNYCESNNCEFVQIIPTGNLFIVKHKK